MFRLSFNLSFKAPEERNVIVPLLNELTMNSGAQGHKYSRPNGAQELFFLAHD